MPLQLVAVVEQETVLHQVLVVLLGVGQLQLQVAL
jgi:hypothetical protein